MPVKRQRTVQLGASLALFATTLICSGCDFKAQALPTTPAADPLSQAQNTATNLPVSTPDQLTTRIRVRADAVAPRTIAAGQSATGTVQAFRKSVVAAEIGGRVAVRRVEPGAYVQANQILLELDAERSQIAYDRARAEAQARQVDYAQAEHELLRGRRLIERNVISQDTLDDLRFNLDRANSLLAAAAAQRDEAARTLADNQIRAPFAGTAEIVHVQTGDYLAPGTPVVTLADFSKVRVIAGVTAAAAANLRVGGSTTIALDAGSASAIQGTIKAIGRISDNNGTFPLELWVSGELAQGLREGMVASVQLPQADDSDVVSVPRSALLRRDGTTFVYVLASGIANLRPVTLGRSDSNYTQVLAGVTNGEQVIIDGLFALRDGAAVELLE